jgi:polyisoprenoid-binding protein YceI
MALLLAAVVFVGGCGGCGQKSQGTPDAGPVASTAASTSVTTSAEPPPELPTYTAAAGESKIELRAAKAPGKGDSGFKTFTATLRLNGNELERSSLEITIDAASVFAEPEKLTTALKSASLLEAERYPQVTFVSTKLEKSEKKGASHDLAGNLTLHGVLKSIDFPANITVAEDGNTIRIEAEFTVERKDFGTDEGDKKTGLVKDKVTFKLDLKLERT